MQIENIIKSRINIISPKKMRIALAIIISVLLAMLGKHAIGAVTQNPIKWHPGHYVTLVNPGKDSSRYMAKVYSELETYSALRGITIRYRWSELESQKDVYNFTSIDKHLAELAERDKRLIILLETKSFKPDEILAPDYLKDAIYEGGVFPFTGSGGTVPKGYNIKLWNKAVHDRLAALIRALGKRYNSHPHFEGFGLQETTMGQPIKPLTSTQVNDYYKNLLSINQWMRNSFPNTMTYQFTNYPRGILESFINGLNEIGTALGCPDIFLEDPGLLFKGTKHSRRGIYSYYPELSGIMPLTIQVEKSNYENTRHDRKGYQPTVQELLTFARDTLKVNYIFWTRSPGYFDDVLQMLNQKSQTSILSGGLDPTCPSNYASCTN
ncbi:glycoside hydrolase [Nitrosomonas sp. Nm166]|uniref:glycoside hydrolase n=1 Tax=Nitrosomonas sp. Nm166 TaxID=1881054 RepID=UPI0008E82212|nr:glycoside hydrolase [Nitrosomonas sp. Nm166]SFE40638.1 hypothetical protein SAMN05428977_101536 [Nitrosomonas sp. Nm166]